MCSHVANILFVIYQPNSKSHEICNHLPACHRPKKWQLTSTQYLLLISISPRMQNILRPTSPREETYNPQSLTTIPPGQPPHHKNTLSQHQDLNTNNQSQIERYFLRNAQLERSSSHHNIEDKDHLESMISRTSISQDWKTAELMEYSRLKRRDDNTANQMNELKKTVKTILKGNEEYRKTLLALQQEKTQLHLQNLILAKKVELLEAERETWQINRQHNQEVESFLRNKGETYKQLYAKNTKRLETEVLSLNDELLQKKKRVDELETYNKTLFQKLAKETQTYNLQLQQSNYHHSELQSKLRTQTLQITELNAHLAHARQRERILNQNLITAKRNQLQLSAKIQHLERNRDELNVKLNIWQRQDEKQYRTRKTNEQELQKQIASLTGELADCKRLDSVKTSQLTKHRKQLEALQQQLQHLRQQRERLNQQIATLNDQAASKDNQLLQLQHQHRRLQNALRQEQTNTQSIQLDMAKSQQESNARCQELKLALEHIQTQNIQATNKFQRLTNDLLNQRRNNQELAARLELLVQQREQLEAQLSLQLECNQQKQQHIEQLLLKVQQHEVHSIQTAAQLLQQELAAKTAGQNYEHATTSYHQQLLACRSQIAQLADQLSQQKIDHDKQKQTLLQLFKDIQIDEHNDIQTNAHNLLPIDDTDPPIHHRPTAATQQPAGTRPEKELEGRWPEKELEGRRPEKELEGVRKGKQVNKPQGGVQPKANGMANLANMILGLKKANRQIQAANRNLQTQQTNLELQLQHLQLELLNCKDALLSKDSQIAQITRTGQQDQLAHRATTSNLQAELHLLRANNQQLRDKCLALENRYLTLENRYLTLEKEFKRCQTALDEQLHAKDREQKALDNVRNLSLEVSQAQKILDELVHPSTNSIKKFVNLMNATHRGNLSREIEKIVEYYATIDDAKHALQKHYNNIKLILASILPLSHPRTPRTPTKHH